MWGFAGVGHEKTGGGVQFNGEMADLEDTYLTGKVKVVPHPFVTYFQFLKQFEDDETVAKYTIPAPAQMFQQMIVPQNFQSTREFYATNEELIHDIGVAYQEVIRQFYDAGCRNCSWTTALGVRSWEMLQNSGISPWALIWKMSRSSFSRSTIWHWRTSRLTW